MISPKTVVCSFLPLFFFNDTATTEIYTLSLHDALPICAGALRGEGGATGDLARGVLRGHAGGLRSLAGGAAGVGHAAGGDRKSTRLNSSHANISYAVFCLKKKNNQCYGVASVSQNSTA